MQTRQEFIKYGLLFFLSLGVVTCNASPSSVGSGAGDRPFRVWWQQGFYPEETQEIQRLVQEWENETGNRVELTFYSDADMLTETNNAIASVNPPDLLFSTGKVETLIPSLAWDNQLVDLSDIITPLRSIYDREALESVAYKNSHTRQTGKYAAPLSQQTIHIHYWKPLVEQAGFSSDRIPQDWEGFWQFWKDIQDELRSQWQQNQKIYAFGFPMSPAASDTYFTFEQFLTAHNVQLISPTGQLQIREPRVRQGLINALTEYTNLYKDGYVPPSAIDWANPDNNVSFLSRNSILTANPSLSIPGSQRQDTQTYFQDLVTIDWPNTLNGDRLNSVSSVKMVVIFKESPNQEQAKSLLSYLIQPENLGSYLQGAQGRYFPVMPKLLEDPFWTNPEDPHISASVQQYQQARPFAQSFNPAYSQVLSDNIWGQVIRAIVADGISPEQAADRAIAQIEGIFSNWEQ